VRKALATLPWVEKDSIAPNVKTQHVTFVVKDKKLFNLDEVKEAIEGKTRFKVGAIISGP
jgi:hypothetical protein